MSMRFALQKIRTLAGGLDGQEPDQALCILEIPQDRVHIVEPRRSCADRENAQERTAQNAVAADGWSWGRAGRDSGWLRDRPPGAETGRHGSRAGWRRWGGIRFGAAPGTRYG